MSDETDRLSDQGSQLEADAAMRRLETARRRSRPYDDWSNIKMVEAYQKAKAGLLAGRETAYVALPIAPGSDVWAVLQPGKNGERRPVWFATEQQNPHEARAYRMDREVALDLAVALNMARFERRG